MKQWAQSAGKREAQASKRHERLRKEYKHRADDLYRELGLYQTTLELQGVADYVLRRQIKERKAVIEAELEPIRAKEWRAYVHGSTRLRPVFLMDTCSLLLSVPFVAFYLCNKRPE